MSGKTSIDAVAELAHLAAADPYTAFERSSSSQADLSLLSARTAASTTRAPHADKQTNSSVQTSPQQSTASALHLLQQLLTSPSNSSTSSSHEVNSTATSIAQATAVQVNSQSANHNPVAASADAVLGPGTLSRLHSRRFTTDAGSTTAAGALQEGTSDWTIIDDFCSLTVPMSWLRRLLHAWHAVARSHTKWRCIQQELLLRRCVAALLSWHRIAALEGKRTSLLAHHLRLEHQLRSVRLAFKAWHDVAAVATAQSSFVMQLLSGGERAMLTGTLRAWQAQCCTKQNVSSVRAVERMQSLRQAMTAWQQWRLFRHYQDIAATVFHRKHLIRRVLHCWRSEWLVRARAKQQLAKQQKYKIQFLQGRWRLQLLHSILASWLNMAAAQAASRAHLSHTLQRVHMQQLLQAWSLAAQERIWLKSAALSAWRQCVHWQHLKPRLLSTALKFQKHRLWQLAVRAWVCHWYRAASGKLIAARHCQRLMATAVHAFSQHARQRKLKYAAWRAAAQNWRRSVFRAFRRGCAVSQQGQCMQELALMCCWASMARRHLHRWQAYTHQQLAKKQRWALAARHRCLWSQEALFAHWAKWFVWQQRKRLSRALGRRTSLRMCLARWQKRSLQTAAIAEAFRSVQIKRLALVTLQRWYQLVLYKPEACPEMLSSCLQAWAAYAHRLPLLRFLLLEQMAIKQARQKAAVFAAWRNLPTSCRAEGQQHGQHIAVGVAEKDSSAQAQDWAGRLGWVMQMAFQGWRAVVLHMAAHREQLQQAALASAERAIQKGCHAASDLSVAGHMCSNVTAAVPSLRLSLLGQQDRAHIQIEQPQGHHVKHTVGPMQTHAQGASCMGVAAAPQRDAVEATVAFFKASAHWSEKLQARVLHAWQELSRQSIASVWQQHELKALANEQLLQLVQQQQQADGHRKQRLLVCAFYPWLECSLHRLHTHHIGLQPGRQYSENAASRTQLVLHGAADAGMQTCPLPSTMSAWDQSAPDIAASGTAADSAGSWHGHSNGCVPYDPLSHVAGSISQCSIAPLLEIPISTNHVSASEQGVCHASEGRAGVKVSGETGPRGPSRQHPTNSCTRNNQDASKFSLCTGRNSKVVHGSSHNISSSGSNRHTGQQRSASYGPQYTASTQALRQLQGTCNREMSEPNVPPRHGHQSSVVHGICQQGKCQGLQSDSDRNQAATAGRGERGQKARSSTADKRKALMKAIRRTTPTRAPSLLPEATQLSGFSAANKPNSVAQGQGAESVGSQSTSVLEVMSSQSQQLLTGRQQGIGGFVQPSPALSGLQSGSRSNALHSLDSAAETCKAPANWSSASGLRRGKNVAGTIESTGRRAVKRSLLSQPEFC